MLLKGSPHPLVARVVLPVLQRRPKQEERVGDVSE
jgi:hypothetical protein